VSQFLDSSRPENGPQLRRLQKEMREYYRNGVYHHEWVRGINAGWAVGSHDAQLRMCDLIPPSSRILEVGCGDGTARRLIEARTNPAGYVGVDLNPNLWAHDKVFVAASAEQLPFLPGYFDVVLSMFVVEHLIFPADFLDETWRVLRPGGRLLIVAPDFERNAMMSERIGLSYGSGRDKLKSRRFLDAGVTLFDSRLRLPLKRRLRLRRLRQDRQPFPILTSPRCLRLGGFVSDCDAVYPASVREITAYLSRFSAMTSVEVFYRSASTFGLLASKSGTVSSRTVSR
jgi:SAM-dependent methyltransferase